MGERVSAWITIGGEITDPGAFEKLATAMFDERVSPEYGEPLSLENARELIKSASSAKETLRLIGHNVNWGEFRTLQRVCHELRLPYAHGWSGAGSFDAGCELWTHDGTVATFTTDGEDTPVLTLDEIKKIVDAENVGESLNETYQAMLLARGTALPAIHLPDAGQAA